MQHVVYIVRLPHNGENDFDGMIIVCCKWHLTGLVVHLICMLSK